MLTQDLVNLLVSVGVGALAAAVVVYVWLLYRRFKGDLMFLNSAYHDCDLTLAGVVSALFWGVYPDTTNPQFGR